jgi:hypothetical protein
MGRERTPVFSLFSPLTVAEKIFPGALGPFGPSPLKWSIISVHSGNGLSCLPKFSAFISWGSVASA